MTSALLQTERTRLKPLCTDYADWFFELNEDPEILQYSGDKAFENPSAAKHFLSEYRQFENYQVGRFAVIHKNENKNIGWCGLRYSPENKEYDLGFRFFKFYWNQGFATETADRFLK